MSDKTAIQWTDATWNPVRGCSRVSEGCRNCYAETMAARFSGRGPTEFIEGACIEVPGGPDLPFHGFAEMTPSGPRWTGKVALIPEKLSEPLHWKKPRRIFVNSMSDLFHEGLAFDEIATIFGVMAAAPQHTFQVLTKRPLRMLEWFKWAETFDNNGAEHGPTGAMMFRMCTSPARWPERLERGDGEAIEKALDVRWPLPNVWLGVSVEDQKTADERIPLLLRTPAAVRFVSAEPLLGPVDLAKFMKPGRWTMDAAGGMQPIRGLKWVIVGGESGPKARPFDIAWARQVVRDCKAAAVPCFVKQLGAWPIFEERDLAQLDERRMCSDGTYKFRDRKGGDMAEWPADLRVREFPTPLDSVRG